MGYASPRKLVDEAGFWQLGLWAALRKINPWGENRADLRLAILCALLANINTDPKKRSKPWSFRDFMPYMQMTPAELEAEVGDRIQAALAEFKGARSGASLKKWRSERRRSVGKEKRKR